MGRAELDGHRICVNMYFRGEFVGGVIIKLFLLYFYFVHSWGGRKSRQADRVSHV